MIRNINTDVYRRLGLVSSDENDNFSDRVSKYTEVLSNKSYSIFLENVTIKTTINDYISNSSNFVARAEGANNTKKNFFRKIIDRILEIWDKFLDWLYRVQIKIVTSRLFKKVNSILGKLKKRFSIYPIEVKVKDYIKSEFIDDSSLNEGLEKYTKYFTNTTKLVKDKFEEIKNFSDKLRKNPDNSNEFYMNHRKKFDNNSDIFNELLKLNSWRSIWIYAVRITDGSQTYKTLKIKNKEEDAKIKSQLIKKVEQIKRVIETVETTFNELHEIGKKTKKSVEGLVTEIEQKRIDNKNTSNLINNIYEFVNLYTTELTKNTSKVVQSSNKLLSEALSILESDLSEFLK